MAAGLLIGSQAATLDNSYQTLAAQLTASGLILEMQMVDRIIDRATVLSPLAYQHISLLLPLNLITPVLLALLEPTLTPGGSLEINGAAASSTELLSELTLAGFGQLNSQPSKITATKSATNSASLSLKRPSSSLDSATTTQPSALPLRTTRAAKASLWAFTAPTSGASTPTIDESTLLTAEDLERPTLLKREDCDVKKTRKACKNCSCGLRELLLDEQEQDDLVAAGFAPAAAGATNGGAKKISSSVVTSSCGSCYLGDAFRCASCPYLGLPAFEPGQKVTISAEMDDI